MWPLISIGIAILLIASAAIAPGWWQDLYWSTIRSWQDWSIYIMMLLVGLVLLVCLLVVGLTDARPDLLAPWGQTTQTIPSRSQQ